MRSLVTQIVLGSLLVVFAGCATPPGSEVLLPVSETAENATRVKIHAATTRERVADGANVFTSGRAERTNYARFDVSIPPGHQPGRIEWPRGRPDPERSFAVLAEKTLDIDALVEAVAGASSAPRQVSLFIHGYNQSFQQALFRVAQMHVDGNFEGSAMLFAWPSQANVAGYVADKDSAAYSRDSLAALLTRLARERRIGEITVVAHSMGAWLTVETLRQLRLSGRQDVLDRLQVVLASPDIDVDLFRVQMKVIGRTRQPIVVLTSPDDRALIVSRRLGARRDRLGALDVTDPRVLQIAEETGIAIVDITGLNAADGLRHSRYALFGAALADLEAHGAATSGQGLRQAGAFIFNAVGSTISSPFTLVGEALAAE